MRVRPLFGSSPLARGASICPWTYGRSMSDHPRSRGVHWCWTRRRSWTVGSSPLARGACAEQGVHRALDGIIPARAGCMWLPATRGRRPWDHPRSRGVHSAICACWSETDGSSPLARGASACPRTPRLRRGIIPARAGCITILGVADDTADGSSPLARGACHDADDDPGHRGIIPARAGCISR